MKKVLKIISIIFLIIIVLLISVFIYVYYFFVFKEVRICITNDIEDSKLQCTSNQQCIDQAIQNMSEGQQLLEDIPKFFSETMIEAFNTAIYCEGTCKIKKMYGMGLEGAGDVVACKPDEKEIVLKIRGKEGLQLIKYMQKTGELGK
ncbi:hypothetical protein HZA33_01505 [Candidatus Pacearchaeota archaeon]|nr:hypothetical protein [Candidatus Pacearchaeota archaeon]